jgi:hypothetical protein
VAARTTDVVVDTVISTDYIVVTAYFGVVDAFAGA